MGKEIRHFDESEIKFITSVINKGLKKKYPWFHEIKFNDLRYQISGRFPLFQGKIFIDKDFFENQWIEHNGSNHIPNPNKHDMAFWDIYGVTDGTEFNQDFKGLLKIAMGEPLIGFSWAGIKIRVKDKPITESTKKENALNLISKMGLYNFLRASGLKYEDIVRAGKQDEITRKVKEEFMKDFMKKLQFGFGLREIDEDPIKYKQYGGKYMEISYIGFQSVVVDVFDDTNMTLKGDFRVPFYNLTDDMIDKVFDVVMDVYENNKDVL